MKNTKANMEKFLIAKSDVKESARKLNECSYIISVKRSEKEAELLPFVKNIRKDNGR